MGIRKKALKAASYAVAPKMAFLVNNPKKAAFAKAAGWAGEQVMDRMAHGRFRPQPKRTSLGMAARGLGAAAVAAPLGWWLGRKLLAGEGAAR